MGAVDNIERIDDNDDNDMALLVLGADTIVATSTGNKMTKEIQRTQR